MTIDKIKHYLSDGIFSHWMLVSTWDEGLYLLKKAEIQLSSELETGLLSGIEYQAELKLIQHLLSN